MYEKHFGLQKHPFTARASGADVFVGPQTAATMAGLKKALQSQDAVIVVSGPAGAGKSTLVGKALDAVASTHLTVRIGRMSLDGADALEFLLEELGVTELPRGTIRQFAALREKLGQLQGDGKRLVIVVEDAVLTGAHTMAEFEALTAADGGASGGAAIIVMGDERLRGFLDDPQLARLAQRVRLRQEIAPLSAAELRGYLAHCFRGAGKEFQEIFDADAAIVIHDLCNGNPRITNNLVDAVLAAAAASNLSPVSGKFIAEVGSNQLGLVASNRVSADPPPVAEPAPEPPSEQTNAAASQTESPAKPEAGEAPATTPGPEETPDPVIVFSDEPRDELLAEEDIPDLIQDTLPDLEVLAPEIIDPETPLEPAPVAEADARPDAGAEPQPAAEPQQAEAAPAAEPAADDIPEWERDPTMAELKPDLEALEKAMAFAHGDDADGEPPVLEPLAQPAAEAAEAGGEEIPEITLDSAVQEHIENSRIEAPDAVSPTEEITSPAASDVPEVQIPANDAKKADQEIERIAAELAKAKTIEDVDDKLAETLFGEEFSLAAAQVAASLATEASANDSNLLPAETDDAPETKASDSPATESAGPEEEPAVEVSLASHDGDKDGRLQPSESQRLRTVRALNADTRPAPKDTGAADPGPDAASAGTTPDPIEDQINISMTQTLKALNVRPPISDQDGDDDADDDKEKTGGFFSRFRRS